MSTAPDTAHTPHHAIHRSAVTADILSLEHGVHRVTGALCRLLISAFVPGINGGAALCARGRPGRRRAAGTFRLAETETSPATGEKYTAPLPRHSGASLEAPARTRWRRGGCRASFHARGKCRPDGH